jgi:hypothetical protein
VLAAKVKPTYSRYEKTNTKKKKKIPGKFLRQLMTQGTEFLFQLLAQNLEVPARLEHKEL